MAPRAGQATPLAYRPQAPPPCTPPTPRGVEPLASAVPATHAARVWRRRVLPTLYGMAPRKRPPAPLPGRPRQGPTGALFAMRGLPAPAPAFRRAFLVGISRAVKGTAARSRRAPRTADPGTPPLRRRRGTACAARLKGARPAYGRRLPAPFPRSARRSALACRGAPPPGAGYAIGLPATAPPLLVGLCSRRGGLLAGVPPARLWAFRPRSFRPAGRENKPTTGYYPGVGVAYCWPDVPPRQGARPANRPAPDYSRRP